MVTVTGPKWVVVPTDEQLKALLIGKNMPRRKFRPAMVYVPELDCMQVILRMCNRGGSMRDVSGMLHLEILEDTHTRKKQGALVGFKLFGVYGMLKECGYRNSSISLEHLVKYFMQYQYHRGNSYARRLNHAYERRLLSAIKGLEFVWHIPK